MYSPFLVPLRPVMVICAAPVLPVNWPRPTVPTQAHPVMLWLKRRTWTPVPVLVTDETAYGRCDARRTVPLALMTAAAFTRTDLVDLKFADDLADAWFGPFVAPPAKALPAKTPTASASATPAAGKSFLVRMMYDLPGGCVRTNRLRRSEPLTWLRGTQQVLGRPLLSWLEKATA